MNSFEYNDGELVIVGEYTIRIEGRYWPATRETPEEYPDVVVKDVFIDYAFTFDEDDNEIKLEITRDIKELAREHIESVCLPYAYIDEDGYVG